MSHFPFGVTAPICVGLLSVVALIWVATRGRRKLRNQDELLDAIIPGQLDALKPFMDPRGNSVIEQDHRFWKGTFEVEGMDQRASNASEIVHLVQYLCHQRGVADKQLEYMISRATIVRACTRFYWIESVLRAWYKEFPHVLGRTSGTVYYEMAQRVTTLCEEYAPELSDRLAAVL